MPAAPCTPGQGIQRWSDAEFNRWSAMGAGIDPSRIVRFVPASGAASCMFKALLGRDAAAVEQLNVRWDEFPFRAAAEAMGPCDTAESRWSAVMERLALPARPKGALPFHVEPDGVKTAFEAQMIEWSKTLDTPGAPHFTLPAADMADHFEALRTLADRMGIPVEASIQEPATDTVALDEAGVPFVKADGTPLFRPGGHGAVAQPDGHRTPTSGCAGEREEHRQCAPDLRFGRGAAMAPGPDRHGVCLGGSAK